MTYGMHREKSAAVVPFLVSPAFLLIILLTTGYAQAHRAALSAFALAIVAVSAAGVSVRTRQACWPALGAAWGLFYAATAWIFGLESWTFLIASMCVAGVAVTGIGALAAELRPMQCFVILLF